jgi:hypothetical protein
VLLNDSSHNHVHLLDQLVSPGAHALGVEPLKEWHVVGPVEPTEEVVPLRHHLLHHLALLAREVVVPLPEHRAHDVVKRCGVQHAAEQDLADHVRANGGPVGRGRRHTTRAEEVGGSEAAQTAPVRVHGRGEAHRAVEVLDYDVPTSSPKSLS